MVVLVISAIKKDLDMKNIIAIIWDFDKTLINGYMQDPIFKDYNVNPHEFWTEVNALPKKYMKEQHVKVNPDTIYLNQFIRYAQSGKFEGLNNAKLKSYGERQNFYAGIPAIFKHTKEMLKNDPVCEEYNIKVEHYIVSTGFAEVIRGTELMNYVENIWGCELIEDEEHKIINEIGFTMDNSTKTKAIFEINKGVNKEKDITVSSKLPDELRRVEVVIVIAIARGQQQRGVHLQFPRQGHAAAHAIVDVEHVLIGEAGGDGMYPFAVHLARETVVVAGIVHVEPLLG